jgi:hypothetical protein
MFKSFFILCSGADKDLLTAAPEQQTKYVVLAPLFFYCSNGFLASAYALFTVFDSIYPLSLWYRLSLLIF